eukprot:351841-Chlamydomonas_euryale.AAC.5
MGKEVGKGVGKGVAKSCWRIGWRPIAPDAATSNFRHPTCCPPYLIFDASHPAPHAPERTPRSPTPTPRTLTLRPAHCWVAPRAPAHL